MKQTSDIQDNKLRGDVAKWITIGHSDEVGKLIEGIYYLGHIVIITSKFIFIYNTIAAQYRLVKKIEIDFSVKFVFPDREFPHLLLISENSIYKLKYEDDFSTVKIIDIEGKIFRNIIQQKNNLIVFIENEQKSFINIFSDHAIVKTIPVEKKISNPCLVDDDTCLFYSSAYLHVLNNNNLTNFPIPKDLEVNIDASVLILDDFAYLMGSNTLYRINLKQNYAVSPFLNNHTGTYFVSFGRNGREIFIADNKGVSVYNSLTGKFLWDAAGDKLLGMDLPCNRFPVQEYGDYIMFSCVKKSGEQIGFINKLKHDSIYHTDGLKGLVSQPIFTNDRLVLPIRDEYSLKLMTFAL